uniref:Tumor protein p53-inducible protein 11 n=1 Tax=Trichobilharzia regenti TaxID=157069 RepID=A0AA85JVM2_TRIRE|nr:unnamed protein product [Trichobilharzia regenti]
MKAFIERKESSSDLLSRYKTRKILGVGESSGNVNASKVTQILGESNESKLEVQHISYIYYWNYFMALLLMSYGLMMAGFPVSYDNRFLQTLFPISNIDENLNSPESCSIRNSYNTQLIFKHFGGLHITLASTMLYVLLMVKTNGIRISQFISSVYTLTILLNSI